MEESQGGAANEMSIEGADSTQVIFHFEHFRVDPRSRQLFCDDLVVPITPKAFDTLLYLLRNPRRVISREQLLEGVWPGLYIEENNLTHNIFLIRKALGEKPGDHRFIVTIPGSGYKFVPEVVQVEVESSIPKIEKRRGPKLRLPWVLASVLAIGIVGLLSWTLTDRPSESDPGGLEAVKSLAVVPFSGTSESEKIFALGMPSALLGRLEDVLPIRVPTGLIFEEENSRSPVEWASILEVDAVISGSVQESGDQIGVLVIILDSEGAVLWTRRVIDDKQRILETQTRVAQTIRKAISGEGPQKLDEAVTEPVPFAAYDAYLTALHHWKARTQASNERALGHLRRALEIVPDYAEALEAQCAVLLTAGFYRIDGGDPRIHYRRARESASRALELSPELSRAQACYGWIIAVDDYDLDRARDFVGAAVEKSPDDPLLRRWYSFLLLSRGQDAEALHEMELAWRLEPASAALATARARVFYYLRRYEEAIHWFDRALELDPAYVRARLYRGVAFSAHGEPEKALIDIRAAAEEMKPSLEGEVALRVLEVGLGQREIAELGFEPESQAYSMALLEAQSQHFEAAVDWLEEAAEKREMSFLNLLLDPRLDPLRKEPRYKELANMVQGRRLDLPTQEGGR